MRIEIASPIDLETAVSVASDALSSTAVCVITIAQMLTPLGMRSTNVGSPTGIRLPRFLELELLDIRPAAEKGLCSVAVHVKKSQ